MVELVKSHTWPTDSFPFATLTIRADAVATRLALTLEYWNVEGLGPACGFGFRGPSGRVYLLQELEHKVQWLSAPGPDILADATDLATISVDDLVTDVSAALDLSRLEIAVGEQNISVAKEFLAHYYGQSRK